MHDDDEVHDHDRGLTFDLSTLLNRRRFLFGVAGTGALAVLAAACGGSSGGSSAASRATTTAATTARGRRTRWRASGGGGPGGAPPGDASSTPATTDTTTGLSSVPEETAGPYPADGSNGTQVLTESGIVRSNIRTSFGSSTTDATGVDTTIQMTVIDTATGKPLQGAAVYLWHCDHAGNYSMYSQSVTDENYLRGVQETDANGQVTFLSYYPACYSGRWPHIHYEVYPDVASITNASNKIATSQMALPDDINKAVFATSLYSGSKASYAQVSLATDNVFSDGTTNEVPTVTGQRRQRLHDRHAGARRDVVSAVQVPEGRLDTPPASAQNRVARSGGRCTRSNRSVGPAATGRRGRHASPSRPPSSSSSAWSVTGPPASCCGASRGKARPSYVALARRSCSAGAPRSTSCWERRDPGIVTSS